jgi:hypothetical protein
MAYGKVAPDKQVSLYPVTAEHPQNIGARMAARSEKAPEFLY